MANKLTITTISTHYRIGQHDGFWYVSRRKEIPGKKYYKWIDIGKRKDKDLAQSIMSADQTKIVNSIERRTGKNVIGVAEVEWCFENKQEGQHDNRQIRNT